MEAEVLLKFSNDAPQYFPTAIADIDNLEKEYADLARQNDQLLKDIQQKRRDELARLKYSFDQGSFVKPILQAKEKALAASVLQLSVFKWAFPVLGALQIYFYKQQWTIAVLMGGAGYFIFHMIQSAKRSVLQQVNRHLKYDTSGVVVQDKASFSEAEQRKIKELSADLDRSITFAYDLEKNNLDEKIASADQRYSEAEEAAKKECEIRVSELERRNKKMFADKLAEIEASKKALEQIPETKTSFDPQVSTVPNIHRHGQVSTGIRVGSKLFKSRYHQDIEIPFVIPFFNFQNIFFDCSTKEQYSKAKDVAHNIVARALLALPPNKIKLSFFDPLELGASASFFTPLSKDIHGGMMYTQRQDIEAQLSVQIRNIERVIQQYLQDKFQNIAEYNKKMQEVPEPYRLLIVYNFPNGFDDESIKKLVNILKSGPRAGIHSILINDLNAKLPYNFKWEDISTGNSCRFDMKADFEDIRLDSRLPYSSIVELANKELPNTSGPKVSFNRMRPDSASWWKEKAHKRFSVPIGRHGTEVQELKFDNEDDNQALLIGKPGSGKSNLLHIIIANSLLKYSPDQLEIYLIDFKGGVEFTIYADKKIPHIRTIAIESEREFGLSVLEGVEKELLRRETEFSKAGVQNIQQFHESYPNVKMPRLLLIVDEFQEFYSEDDGIKQSVDDKFDRIIRKGRAFGINTLFSSQTLSGNSIKKSTKELIDIRIALMCSDSDAHQILSDKNHAARDLSKPGEGIYNAENGKVEGNRQFQAFFIEKNELHKTIDDVVAFAKDHYPDYQNVRQIIFRGSEKARMQRPEGHPVESVMPAASPRSVKLWIGEPVAIAEDVTAVIRKQSGYNLLIAGADESIGVRTMCSAVISLAAQYKKGSLKFYSFNFLNIDSAFADTTQELFESTEHDFEIVQPKKTLEVLRSLKSEAERRIGANVKDAPDIYICIFSFQRARTFRKENGYSMNEEGSLLAYMLQEGPDVGIFVLMQLDAPDNFTKNLDDSLLKEFSQRIASQMNPENSVKVIGNQKASKLGSNRAWYYDDNENVMVKFKPYELPVLSWVSSLVSKA